MIKAAFFDIDGTLLSFKTHEMPASTVRALARLRERGVRLVISSGRPSYQLPEFLRESFDAYVLMNGQLCLDADGVFRSCPIDETDVRRIVGHVREGRYDVLVLQRERAFANELTPRVVSAADHAGLVYEQDDIERTFDAPVYQFCAFLDPEQDEMIRRETEHVATTRWTTIFCDVVPEGGGKAAGVAAVLERWGLSPEEAIAFGDGENDLSMFEAVGTSVAMGNAWDSVKERATFTTTDVDDDGIWNACEHFGLV